MPRGSSHRNENRRCGGTGLLPKPHNDRGRTRKAGTAGWVGYATGLLHEQPDRSLSQIEIYLRDVLREVSQTPASRVHELTPLGWKRRHQDVLNQAASTNAIDHAVRCLLFSR